ncbi:hypothetical protein [Motilibacter deserti]|uniref:Type II secretion system protein GspF domain-containing protein n=1 Tax=Motilibacter deserti TaxID=2714956 RepID=A0ABX0GRM4_9ACTN|nr:hypothetical protein [Motilibacter deserti]NHC13133.1 hypothetical protein [Motilibacter deserti]
MLANLLPGLRDFRTPLAAGYTLAITLWLLLEERVPREERAPGALRRLYELADIAGRPILVAFFSFCCYLLGSLLVVRKPPAFTLFGLARFLPDVLFVQRGRAHFLNRLLSGADKDEARATVVANRMLLGRPRHLAAGALALGGAARVDTETADVLRAAAAGRADVDSERLLIVIRDVLLAAIIEEREILQSRLLARSKDLWSEYDRHQSEAELRLTLVAPLAFLALVLAGILTPWALFGLLLVVLLYRQGVARYRAGQDVVLASLLAGEISAPAMDAFTQAVARAQDVT